MEVPIHSKFNLKDLSFNHSSLPSIPKNKLKWNLKPYLNLPPLENIEKAKSFMLVNTQKIRRSRKIFIGNTRVYDKWKEHCAGKPLPNESKTKVNYRKIKRGHVDPRSFIDDVDMIEIEKKYVGRLTKMINHVMS